MLRVKELKQYIQWLIDNDMDENNKHYKESDYCEKSWRNTLLESKSIKINNNDNVFYSVILEDIKIYINVYEKHINEWRFINRQQKLERICDDSCF